MRSKQRYEKRKQRFSEGWQQAVLKLPDSTTTSTALSPEITKSATHGQTHTNPTNTRGGKYLFEDGEWWYLNGEDGGRRRADSQQARQNTRMWVDGKYISKSHPLYKAGRYKGFEDAAFSSLENYTDSAEGAVYVIANKAWDGWVKVGMAIDAEDRLKSYQTSSPFRDYMLYYSYTTDNRRKSEAEAHSMLEQKYERRNEWFLCTPSQAIEVLNGQARG